MSGLIMEFITTRITGTVDFYTRNSYDLIGLFSTSGVGGGAGQDNDAAGFKYGNYADMKSDGFEFSINTLNIKRKGFYLDHKF